MTLISKRLKYYFIFYIVGYLISLCGTGIPNLSYLIPFKLVAFCLMLVGGNGVYYVAEENENVLIAFYRILKYILISFLLLFVFAILQKVLNQNVINLAPIVGI